jgi:hypothetical protein
MDELTLDACVESLKAQTVPIREVHVVSGRTPNSTAYNEALDIALAEDADVLFHTAADVIAEPIALKELLRNFDVDHHYASVGSGFDVFFGERAPVGLWALNLRIIGERFRFKDVFKMDLRFCEDIESATGTTRLKVDRKKNLGYHHPIWTPEEMFMKFRYVTRKYDAAVRQRLADFFVRELERHPDNVTLQIGYDTLRANMETTHDFRSKDNSLLAREFEQISLDYHLQGVEFYVLHERFLPLAKEILGIEESPLPRSGSNPRLRGSFQRARSLLARLWRPWSRIRDLEQKVDSLEQNVDSLKSDRRDLQKDLAKSLRRVKRAKQLARSLRADLQNAAKEAATESRNSAALRVERTELVREQRRLQKRLEAREALVAERKLQRKLATSVVNEVADMHEGRSLTPGVEAWREKWERSRGRRILYFAPEDYAGSFYKWADAVNQHSDYAVRLVSLSRHRYGYPLDILMPYGAALSNLFPDFYSYLIDLADSADIIHIKDQTGFIDGRHGLDAELFTQFGKPIIFTHYGGEARYQQYQSWYQDHVRSFSARVAMTPDLCFEWTDWEFIPHSISTDQYPYSWTDSRRIAHSPSTKERKGTETFISTFESTQMDLELEVIHNVSYEEAISRKQKAALFFDQAGREREDLGGVNIGWYGNSALEAAVAGIPVMAHLSEEAFDRAERSGVRLRDWCPIINVEPTIESMRRAIESFFKMEAEDRSALSKETRQFIEDFHSQQAVARRLGELYDRILAQ